MSNAASFSAFAVQAGYGIIDPVEGCWTRCTAPGDKGKKRSASYRFFDDDRPRGDIRDWKTGEVITWEGERTRTDQARRQMFLDRARERENERIRTAANVAIAAQMRWRRGGRVGGHAYLDRKQVSSHGLRREGNALLIPVRASNGAMVNLQSILPDGKKLFMKGGQTQGCVFLIGPRITSYDGPIAVAEGYATAASIHQATEWPCFVTFDAHGMEKAASWMAEKWKNRQWIVCGDDDWSLPLRDKPLPNVGMRAAERAAKTLSGTAILPERSDEEWTDFNDQHCKHGLQSVRDTLFSSI